MFSSFVAILVTVAIFTYIGIRRGWGWFRHTWAALGQKAPTNAELRASHETAVRLDDTDLDEVELAKFQAIIDRFKEEE